MGGPYITILRVFDPMYVARAEILAIILLYFRKIQDATILF